jgi:uncharacterized YccA/Bax inhibitor family protein
MKELKAVIGELLTSKKFISAVSGLIVLLIAKMGFQASPEAITGIIAIISTLLLGQGLADFGKAKEEISNAPKMKVLENILNKTETPKEEPKA